MLAPLAQLDRAFGYGPEGRGFESLRARDMEPANRLGFAGLFFCWLLSVKVSLVNTPFGHAIPLHQEWFVAEIFNLFMVWNIKRCFAS